MIQDNQGNIIIDHAEIKEHFIQHFQSIFGYDDNTSKDSIKMYLQTLNLTKITERDNELLNVSVTRNEIKTTLFQMSLIKCQVLMAFRQFFSKKIGALLGSL